MRRELPVILDKRLYFNENLYDEDSNSEDLLKNAGNRYEPPNLMKGRGRGEPCDGPTSHLE